MCIRDSSRIDNEIINISKISLNNAINIISNNRVLLEKLVELLLIKETVENNTFKKITFDLLKVWLNKFNLYKNFSLIIKFSLLRLSIIILLVILFPLVQKQWLNLYLFDINNLSIYKLLYYLSGLFVPVLVIINSLNKFTYYQFNLLKKINYK